MGLPTPVDSGMGGVEPLGVGMGVYEVAAWLPLAVLVTWAAVEDLRWHKIRNWLTLMLTGTGLMLALTPAEFVTVRQSVGGMLLGFGLSIVLFVIGGMGGGDVKLMSGVGAWVGPWGVVTVFLVAVVVGAVMGVGMSLWQGRLRVVLGNTAIIGMSLLNAPRLGVEHVKEVGRACGGTKKGLPFAVPIWIGTVLTLFTPVQAWLLGR